MGDSLKAGLIGAAISGVASALVFVVAAAIGIHTTQIIVELQPSKPPAAAAGAAPSDDQEVTSLRQQVRDLKATVEALRRQPAAAQLPQVATQVPTVTAVVPTAVSTPTPRPDTRPGSVLEVGETWRQSGLELQLSSANLRTNGLEFAFTLVNRKPDKIILRFTLGDTFSVIDNQKQRYVPDRADYIYTLPMNQNDSINLTQHLGNSGVYGFFARIDTASPQITELFITATGISENPGITNARWHILVHH